MSGPDIRNCLEQQLAKLVRCEGSPKVFAFALLQPPIKLQLQADMISDFSLRRREEISPAVWLHRGVCDICDCDPLLVPRCFRLSGSVSITPRILLQWHVLFLWTSDSECNPMSEHQKSPSLWMLHQGLRRLHFCP